MKYQSEIIKNLIENKGHHVTTNPHYEVDCINEIINDVRGSYPKLCDYMGEWLNYANNHVNIGKFPTERVVNVTNARFDNVVPYGYKSAILKGNTLVNLIDNGSERKEITYSRETKANYRINKDMLVANKTYLLLFTVTDFSGDAFHVSFNKSNQDGVTYLTNVKNGLFKAKVNFSDLTSIKDTMIIYKITGTALGGYVENVMLVEYQEGMENWDIPYFEGMQSVRMPVLTTTGKNIFDGELELGAIDSNTTGENVVNNSWKRTVNYLKVEPNTEYVYSLSLSGAVLGIRFYDENKKFIRDGGTKPNFTTPTNCRYIRFNITTTKEVNIQIEKGSTVTSYEPYKSNILSTSEDVELRGIGNVRDELDLLTGELIQNIGEVVLDGNGFYVESQDDLTFTFAKDGNPVILQANKFLSNRFSNVIYVNGTIRVIVNKSEFKSIDDFKENLLMNNLIILFAKSQKSIKTVDLSCLDENNNPTKFKPYEGVMYVVTSSETLPPLLDMEIPVEAINQNLMSFIK